MPRGSRRATLKDVDANDGTSIAQDLRPYFESRNDIVMTFVFGSQATGAATCESDVDIAVYFDPSGEGAGGPKPANVGRQLDIETDRVFPAEDEVWNDIEDRLHQEVDLVVLNRAPATLAASVFYDGEPIMVRDEDLYRRFFLEVTQEAEDFREFAQDFLAIKSRSRSLSEVDRARLARVVDFLDDELEDAAQFTELSREQYRSDRTQRRNVERWIENIVNATIDIAKIILASERTRLPQTYRETIEKLGDVEEFDPKTAQSLAGFARLRNILAHEYLDMRFSRIRAFLDAEHEAYGTFRTQIDAWMHRQERDDE